MSDPDSGTRLRTSILASALQHGADVAEVLRRRMLHFAAPEDGRWLAEGTLRTLVRAWQAAGLDRVRTLLGAPVGRLRRLVRRRVIDLAMVRGVRWTG